MTNVLILCTLGPCTSHLPLLALNKVVEMSVDQLHNLLFTENHQWHETFIVSSNRSGITALLFRWRADSRAGGGGDDGAKWGLELDREEAVRNI